MHPCGCIFAYRLFEQGFFRRVVNVMQVLEHESFAKVRFPFQLVQLVADGQGRRGFYFFLRADGKEGGGFHLYGQNIFLLVEGDFAGGFPKDGVGRPSRAGVVVQAGLLLQSILTLIPARLNVYSFAYSLLYTFTLLLTLKVKYNNIKGI